MILNHGLALWNSLGSSDIVDFILIFLLLFLKKNWHLIFLLISLFNFWIV